MRFLVIAYALEPLDLQTVGDAPLRANRLREKLMAEGKIIEHAHIAGQLGHIWVYDIETVDELDRLVYEDPMSAFSRSNPLVLPLTSYERMAERERQSIGTVAADQADASMLSSMKPTTRPGDSRFLVVAYAVGRLDSQRIGDAPARANRFREELMFKGKLSAHAHIAGQLGHMWIYHVSSVDELDKLVADDPMAFVLQSNPMVLPLCSYERMHDREVQFFGEHSETV